MNRRTAVTIVLVIFSLTLGLAGRSEAFLYHATKKAAAKQIVKKGIIVKKFRKGSRYGKGLYLSTRPSTAVAEKGKRSAVVRMLRSKYLKKKTLDLRSPSRTKLRKHLGKNYDLRGKVKKKVIGPKAGRKLGVVAGNQGKVIKYRSVRNGGSNLFVPKKTLEHHPRIIRPEKVMK